MKIKFKDKVFLSVLAVALLFFLAQKIVSRNDSQDENLVKVEIRDKEVQAELADVPEKLYRGLSNRMALDKNEGMLFVHDDLGRYGYMMRDMEFDLDFIFIRDNQVVDIAKNVGREFSGVVRGATDYNKVLEVRAGWVKENGIEIGDEVSVGD